MDEKILIKYRITDKDRKKHSNLHAMQLVMLNIWKEYKKLLRLLKIEDKAEFIVTLSIKRP